MNPRVAFATIIVLAVIIGVAVFVMNQGDEEPASSPAPVASQQPTAAGEAPSQTIVTFTSSGFSPQEVTVQAGQTVSFVNESNNPVVVASDPHPTHTGLGGFESNTLQNGDTYKFTFEEAGSFGFHNHLNPSQTGQVTVE